MASSTVRAQTDKPHAQPASGTWHTLSPQDAAARLQASLEQGLSAADAAKRLQQQGPNAFAEVRGRSLWMMFIAQFMSLIVLLLAAATAVALALGDTIEALAILAVIVINALIGFLTEWKAEQALAALKKQTVPTAHVIRDGKERQIPAEDLVPGDIVILAAGGRVPADGRVVEATRLQIDEAPLTGESHAVVKQTEPLPETNVALGDLVNMAFLGTTVVDGRGKLLVAVTGQRTEIGKIGTLIEEAGTRTTPLEQKLTRLGRVLVAIVVALAALIVLAGWLRGATDFWRMLEIGISLAIAAVPEGLPAVATMTLALGMQRMARQRALIRRLPAVETLGSTTIICTDKTGTLTKNEMTVQALVLGERRLEITGSGYSPEGEFREGGKTLSPKDDEHLMLALRICALCNDAKVERSEGREEVLGDPTEAALLVAAEKAGLDRASLESEYPRIDEVPFNSETKRMITEHRAPREETLAYVKGAPGPILEACRGQQRGQEQQPLTEEDRGGFLKKNEELAGQALRVLALAYRKLPEGHSEEDLGRDLVFVGLVGMLDPLREEAKTAIAICREAGIRTIMITGDQQPTAAEIARQLGLERGPDGRELKTVHARDLEGLDEAGWQGTVESAGVFARVSPKHKLRIVEALQKQGHIVAMTGDGVNDAPALKKADIGIAMGIKGTEVAKETSAMIITDDNFATIVGAVEQGRIIYANILRFIHYLFSCNFSEILVVFVAIMVGWPLPLAALQVLWLNIITDIFPALALALEPSAPDIMKRQPRNPKEPLLSPQFLGLIAWQGLLLTAVTLLAFAIGLSWHGREEPGVIGATTMAFMTLALAQVFHAFNARSQRRSAFTARLFTNGWLWGAVAMCVLLQLAAVYVPLLQRVLRTAPLTMAEWGVVAGCSLLPVAVVEVVKLLQRAFTVSRSQKTDR
jgi:Ca2+-transporting ATPase